MAWIHAVTGFYLERGTYLNFCVMRDKTTQKELFRSGKRETRGHVCFELQNFLNSNPLIINEVS